jgi:hypothetical protein
VYESVLGSTVTTVVNNGTITFPETVVGSTSSATVRIRNTGNVDGQVNTIAIAGATVFQLGNQPFLPVTIPTNGAISFTVSFTPIQSGPVDARVRIDNTTINLSGTGLGSNFSLSVRQGTVVTPVADKGTVTYPNTTVGATSTASIRVTNGGNTTGTINSISSTGDGFAFDTLPGLPITLGSGQSVEFGVNFVPSALGTASGAVRIDALTVNLMGVGVAPPPLPAVLFANVGDTADPAQQPAVGLTLAAPYPLEVTGRLTITFSSEAFVDDAAIQFSSGGRSVNFVIPANSTQALFGQGVPQVQFQTGTVAGTITITATFNRGSVNLTPAPAPVKTIVIASSAPQIRSVQIGNRSASGFDVVVTGYATPRSVTGMTLRFQPSPGANLQTTTLSPSVEGAFSAWYQGANSAPFGSQFTAVINILVTGDSNAVQSVEVTAANSKGTSAAVSTSLR